MRTFDDLLKYEIGEEVQLFNAPRQNPLNSFGTGTKGKIIAFFEDGFQIITDKGERITAYLPFVCTKCKENIIKEDANAGNSPFDADEVFHKEMKNKYAVRAKIFQQAMESCKSSSPMDCIEWFADRITDLEKENAELDCQKNRNKSCYSCANATERCFKNEIGCPCQKYKSYKDEITELKKRNGELAEQFLKELEK